MSDFIGGLLEAEFNRLQQAREKAGYGTAEGLALSPEEHEAFARLYTYENPILGLLGLPLMIPAYQAAKAGGYKEGFAPEYAMAQMAGGYRGLGRGLLDVFTK